MPSQTENKDTPTPRKKKKVETDPTILALRSVQRITQLFRELPGAERCYVLSKLASLDRGLKGNPMVEAGPIAGPDDIHHPAA